MTALSFFALLIVAAAMIAYMVSPFELNFEDWSRTED